MHNTLATPDPNAWLVFRLSALGDVVLTTGVLDFWQRTRGWRFTVITRAGLAPVFEGHPAVDAVLELERDDLSLRRVRHRMQALAGTHAGQGFLDLHGTLRSRLAAWSWPGPVRRYPKFALERRLFLASRGRWGKDTLLRWNVPQRYALAVEATAPPRNALRPRIWLSDAERAAAQQRLGSVVWPPLSGFAPDGTILNANDQTASASGVQTAAGHTTPLVALHPYATHPAKAWRPESWLELTRLLDAAGLRWFVLGQGRMPGFAADRDFSNQTSLRESCALLAQASVLVTGDSGPLHLACAVGTPVVALFGPTTREWGFAPEGPADQLVEAPFPCRPCSLHGRGNCERDTACMAAISPETVLDAVRRVLSLRQDT